MGIVQSKHRRTGPWVRCVPPPRGWRGCARVRAWTERGARARSRFLREWGWTPPAPPPAAPHDRTLDWSKDFPHQHCPPNSTPTTAEPGGGNPGGSLWPSAQQYVAHSSLVILKLERGRRQECRRTDPVTRARRQAGGTPGRGTMGTRPWRVREGRKGRTSVESNPPADLGTGQHPSSIGIALLRGVAGVDCIVPVCEKANERRASATVSTFSRWVVEGPHCPEFQQRHITVVVSRWRCP